MNLILYLFIIFFWIIIPKKSHKDIVRYSIVVGIITLLIIGLRNEAIYGDTLNYVLTFIDLQDYTPAEILFFKRKDPTFYLLSYFLGKITGEDYTIWLLIITTIFILPFTYLIKRYSPDPLYAWLCFFFIGIYFFVMAGLRQTVAMGFIIAAFLLLINNKEKWFWCCLFLAYLFHGASLIFIIAYPVIKKNIPLNTVTFFSYLILFGIVAIFGKNILLNAIEVIQEHDERYISYGNNLKGSTLTYFIQQFLIVIPSLYILRDNLQERSCRIFAHLSLIALIAVSMSPVIAEMFRLSMYFSWADVILFSMAMSKIKTPFYKFSYIFLISLYLIFINGTLQEEYFFYFQDTTAFIETHYTFL